MEISFTPFRNYQLAMMLMPRGAYQRMVIREGEHRVLAVIRGCLTVQICGKDRPQRILKATPGSPVFLVSPGSYHVTAESHTVGVRGVHHG